MTNEAAIKAAKAKKVAIQMIVGGVFGGISMIALTTLLPMKRLEVDEFILFSIGAIWAIIGLFVLLGSASPKLGSRTLNVADEEDLMEQRRLLLGSALIFLTWGGSHIIIALSGSAGLFPAWAGVGAILFSLACGILISLRDRHLYDEMMWKLTMDASYLCFFGLWIAFSIWCAMSVAGLAAAPTPAVILALLSGGYLLTTFIAAGRAGLLAPK